MNLLDRIISPIVSPPAFGLDISDFTIKFIKIRKTWGGEMSVSEFGEVKLPEGIVAGGEIKKADELTKTLKDNLATSDGRHFADKFVVATLPEEKSFVRVIQLPKMKPKDAGKAARWELEGVVPVPIGELYFDHTVLPQPQTPGDHIDLLVTAFPKVIVDGYAKVLEGAGFIPAALELESQAISRALWSGQRQALIFADLGATRMSLMTVVDGALIFTRSIPMGGFDFNRAVRERLGVSDEEARRLKVEVGLSRDYEGGAVYEALIPLVSALADEFKKQINFYREHSRHRHGMPGDISGIILAGGDANLIGLTNYLSIALKKEAGLGNPLSRFISQKRFEPPFSKSHSLKYTTAIGAALRGIKGLA